LYWLRRARVKPPADRAGLNLNRPLSLARSRAGHAIAALAIKAIAPKSQAR